MKEKILPFIIGVLVGAIIATGCFCIYNKTHKPTFPEGNFQGGSFSGEKPDFENGERPELPEGMSENGERPEMPDKDNSKDTNKENTKAGETNSTETTNNDSV